MQQAIILAAGKGIRLNSNLPKPLHKLLDVTMIELIIKQILDAGIDKIIVVVGYKKEILKQKIISLNKKNNIKIVEQNVQNGTADALLKAKQYLTGTFLVISADTPLITHNTITDFINKHNSSHSDVSILTGYNENPTGYGRILRNNQGKVIKIVEEIESSTEEKKIKEINSGIYLFNSASIYPIITRITNDNRKEEFYLTDIIKIANLYGKVVNSFLVSDENEILGVNDRIELSYANKILKNRINDYWMKKGVTISDPDNVYISPNAQLGKDNFIQGNVHIYGKTCIGENNIIIGDTKIIDSTIGNNNNIQSSFIDKSTINNSNNIGPFSNLREGTSIKNKNRIGNFVELKKSIIGTDVKISHLSYIGDMIIEDGVNIGCGFISSNYNGFKKFNSLIKRKAFIGSNVNIISPVIIGEDCFIAAGCTITKDVPSDCLVVNDREQKNIPEKGKKLKLKYKREHENSESE